MKEPVSPCGPRYIICVRTRSFEFPPNDAIPLVQFQRKISVALDPLCVVLVVVSE